MRIRFVVFLLIAFAVIATAYPLIAADGQSSKAQVDQALKAAPKSITEHATIATADGKVLRQGSNGWTCLPDMGPGSSHPGCFDEVWMQFMHAMMNKSEFKSDRVGISYMLAGDDNVNNADPFDKKQDPGEVWVAEGPHLMIAVPDPKMLEGISDDPKNGGPYVMWKGTPYAHIMVPVASHPSK
ncbi:MAG TPA: hypothetical protein VN577_15160 [Terriglobales bacterium]|nr:hypothetical protein [Terriglobales bacterium]